MKTQNPKSAFPGQMTFKPCHFLRVIALIVIASAIYSCASLTSTNDKARLRAVNKITDQSTLFKVALEDKSIEIKRIAFNKITDENYLNRFATESKDQTLRLEAVRKITDQNTLCKIALEDMSNEVKIAAFNKITDESLLVRFVQESKDLKLLLEAVRKITDQNTLCRIALENLSTEVRVAAFNKITDENLLNRLAIESRDSKLRMEAVKKITDQNTLFRVASEDLSYEVKLAAINKITDENLIVRLVKESKDLKLRLEAVKKITDQNTLYKIALEDKFEIQVAAMKMLMPDQLARLAIDFETLNLKLKVIDLLNDQNELMNISQFNDNWDVRKAAFKKLNDNSLDIMSRQAKDPAVILSSNIRLGRTSWSEAFSSKKNPLNHVVGAAALVETPKPTSEDVVEACHNFIKLGDASRIPELVYLLNTYGDKYLAEDYMNCGESTLEDAGCSWGRAHGYQCTTGYGSHRVRWGSKR